jgi:hypothetical protein
MNQMTHLLATPVQKQHLAADGLTQQTSPFTRAQVGLVVTQRANTGIAPVAHDVPVDIGIPLDLTGLRHNGGL